MLVCKWCKEKYKENEKKLCGVIPSNGHRRVCESIKPDIAPALASTESWEALAKWLNNRRNHRDIFIKNYSGDKIVVGMVTKAVIAFDDFMLRRKQKRAEDEEKKEDKDIKKKPGGDDFEAA